MYDNGLLKYYREKAYRDGILRCEDLPMEQVKNFARVGVYYIDGAKFYTKIPRYTKNFTKTMQDAEVLISQIYNRAGIQSAIYLPATGELGDIVISNDVEKSDNTIVLAEKFWEHIKDETFLYMLDFLYPGKSEYEDISSYFTNRALQQQTKLRIFDIASYNTDRHEENFYYKMSAPFQQQVDGKPVEPSGTSSSVMADDVVAIDNEQSGITSSRILTRLEKHPDDAPMETFYLTDFNGSRLNRGEALLALKENEPLGELLNKSELAEEIGSISPSSVAQDIKDTIGYEVDPKYVDFLEKSYNEVAEALMQ